MSLCARLRPVYAVALAAAVLLTSACQLRLDVGVDVNRSGGGTLTVGVAADQEMRDRAAAAGADPLSDLVARAEELAARGWRTDDTTDGDVRTVTLSASFDDPAGLAALSRELSDTLAADEAALLEPLALTVTDDEVRLRGGAALRPTRAVRDYGVTPRGLVRLLRRTDAFVYTVTADLPGQVLSTTAQARDGDTLLWTVEPGSAVRIAATSTRPPPALLPRVAAGLAVAGLVAVVLLRLTAERRRSARRAARRRAARRATPSTRR